MQGGYPAWEYKVDSELRKVMVETFIEQYGKEPVVSTIHAGLECGLFLGKKPDLDCVSMGPDLLDIHSFNENELLLMTEAGKVLVKGEQLHVKGLDLEKGEAEIAGKVNSISYLTKGIGVI